MISPPQSLDEQEEDEQQDNSDDDDSIQLTATKEEAIKFVKNNFGVIKRFLTSEECNYLKKETSFAKGSIGSFLIGTGVTEELNEAIKETINKMGKANKCFNLILNNAHAVYVCTVLKMFNELEVPKGNCMKNESIIKLMNHIFPTKSVPKVIEKGQKETPQKSMKSASTKSKKIEINLKAAADDWHQSTIFSRAELLAFVFSFNTFIKNPLHQPHSKECIPKLRELCRENPQWAEKCKVEDLTWSDITDVSKAMWRKYHRKTDEHKKYERFLSLAKTFYKYYL